MIEVEHRYFLEVGSLIFLAYIRVVEPLVGVVTAALEQLLEVVKNPSSYLYHIQN
jgi:hypothetical protein